MSQRRPNLQNAAGGFRTETEPKQAQNPSTYKKVVTQSRGLKVYDKSRNTIQELTATLKEQEAEIARLETEARKLNESRLDERTRRQAAKAAQAAAEDARADASLKFEQAQVEATKANEKSTKLENELQNLQKQKERISQALKAVTQDSRFQTEELKRANTNSAKYVLNAKRKLEVANDQKEAAQANILELQKELAAVNAQIRQKEEQKQSADKEVELLKSELDKAKTKFAESERNHKETVKRLNAKAQQAEQSRKDAETSLRNLEESTQANKQRLLTANKRVKELTTSKEAAEERAKTLSAEKENAQQEITNAKKAVTEAKTKITKSEQEITRLTTELKRSESNVTSLRERLQLTSTAQANNSATIDELTKRLKASTSNVTRLEEEQQRLKNATDVQAVASTAAIAELTTELETAKSVVARLETERNRLQSTADAQTAESQRIITELQEQLKISTTDVTSLNEQLEALKSTVQKNQAKAEKATKTITEVNAKNEKIEADLQTARTSAETAKAEAAATRNEIADLKSELERNRASTAKVESKLRAANAKVRIAENELAAVKDANQTLSQQNERLVAQKEEAQTNADRARRDAVTASNAVKELEHRLEKQDQASSSERDDLRAQIALAKANETAAKTKAQQAEDELTTNKSLINQIVSEGRQKITQWRKMLEKSEEFRNIEHETYTKEINRLNSNRDLLTKQVREAKATAQITIEKLTRSLDELKSAQNAQITPEDAERLSQLETYQTNAKEKIQELESRLEVAQANQVTDEIRNRIRETGRELKAVQAKNEELQNVLDTNENEILSLRSEASANIASLQTIIDEQKVAADEQQRVSDELEAQNRELSSENKGLEDQLATVTAELKSSKSDAENAEAAKVAAEDARKLLEAEQQRLQEQIANIQTDLLAKTTAATTNSVEVDKLRRELEKVTAERNQIEAYAAEIEEAKLILSTSEGRLTEDNALLAAQVETLTAEIKDQRTYLTNAIQAAFPQQLTFSDQTFTYTNQQVILESLLDDVSLDALNEQVKNIRDGNIRTINEAIDGLRNEKAKIEKVNAKLRETLKVQGNRRKNAESKNAELLSKVKQQERALEAFNKDNAKLRKSLNAQGEQLKQTKSRNAELSSKVQESQQALETQSAQLEEAEVRNAQAKEALLQAVQVAFPQEFTFSDQTVSFDSANQQAVLKSLLENADVNPEAVTKEIEDIRSGHTKAIQDVINGLISSKNEEIQAIKTRLEASNAALAEQLRTAQERLEAERASRKSTGELSAEISSLKQSLEYEEKEVKRLERNLKTSKERQDTLQYKNQSLEFIKTQYEEAKETTAQINASVLNAVARVTNFVDLAGSANVQAIIKRKENAQLIDADALAGAVSDMATAFENKINSFTDQGLLGTEEIERRAKALAEREAAVNATQRGIEEDIADRTEALRTENLRLREELEKERAERNIHDKIEEVLGVPGDQESETSLAQRAYSLLSAVGITAPVVSNEDVVNAVKTLVDDKTEKEALRNQNAALQERLDTLVEYTTNPNVLDAERLNAKLNEIRALRRKESQEYQRNLSSLRGGLQAANKDRENALQQGAAQTEASGATQKALQEKVRNAEERARTAEERARTAEERAFEAEKRERTAYNEKFELELGLDTLKKNLSTQDALRTVQSDLEEVRSKARYLEEENSQLEKVQSSYETTFGSQRLKIQQLTEQLTKANQDVQVLNERNTTLTNEISAFKANVQEQFDQSTAGLQYAIGQANYQNAELEQQFSQLLNNANMYISQQQAEIQTLTAQLYAQPEPTIDQWTEYQRVVSLLEAAQERESKLYTLEQQLNLRDKQLTSRIEALDNSKFALNKKIERQTRLNEEALVLRQQLRNEEARIQEAIAEAVSNIRRRGQGQLDDASGRAAQVLQAAEQVLADAQTKAADVEANAQRNAGIEADNIIAAAKAEALVLIDQGKQQAQEQTRALRAQENDLANVKKTLLDEIAQERQDLQRLSEAQQAQLLRNAQKTLQAQQQELETQREQIQKERMKTRAELDALRTSVEQASVASNNDKLAQLTQQVFDAQVRTRDASAIAHQLQVRNSDIFTKLQATEADLTSKNQDIAQLRTELESALAENARLQSQESAMDTAEAIATPDTNVEIDKYLLRILSPYQSVYGTFTTKPTLNMWNAMWRLSNRSYSPYASSGVIEVMGPRGIGTQRLMDLALRSQNVDAIQEALQKINSMTSGTHRKASVNGVFVHLVGLFVGDEAERIAIRTLSDSNFVDTPNTIGWIEVMIALVRDLDDVRIFDERLATLTQTGGTSAQDLNKLLVDVAMYVRAQAFSTNPQTGAERVR